MHQQVQTPSILHQFTFTLQSLQRSAYFIRDHRIWEGFWRYGWVGRMLVIGGLALGLHMFQTVWQHWKTLTLTGGAKATAQMAFALPTVMKEEYNFLFNGSMRFLILILMEVIVFHCVRTTLEILKKEQESGATLKHFVDAQIRMIKITIRAWVMATILSVLTKIALGIFGLEWMQPAFVFVINCYYLGFALLDNYNEQYGMTIKESDRFSLRFAGVALAVGMVSYLLMLIPLVGAVVAPVLCAVTAALVMFDLDKEHRSIALE